MRHCKGRLLTILVLLKILGRSEYSIPMLQLSGLRRSHGEGQGGSESIFYPGRSMAACTAMMRHEPCCQTGVDCGSQLPICAPTPGN